MDYVYIFWHTLINPLDPTGIIRPVSKEFLYAKTLIEYMSKNPNLYLIC